MVTQVMASTRLRLSTLRISTSRPTGAIWRRPCPAERSITKAVQRVGERQPIDPMMKTAMATKNRARTEPVGGPAAARDEIASASR